MLKNFHRHTIINIDADEGGRTVTVKDLGRIFSNIPTIKTERLILRKLAVSDCFDMYDYSRLKEVTEYLTWSPHHDIEYTKAYLKSLPHHYKTGAFYDWAIVLADSEKMIGTCGFTRFDLPNNSAEIGYVINPEYRGQGIAVEAAAAVLEYGFETLLLNRIEARYMNGNTASRRVMEKLGMTFEGIRRGALFVKGAYRDIGTCAILKDEFIKKSK